MTEEEKQRRAINTSVADLELKVTELTEGMLEVFSIVSRWAPDRRRRALHNTPKLSAAFDMMSAYMESSKSMLSG